VKPLGCRTHLEAKAEGEISMFEKAGCIETIKGHARRDPDGMVKAELPEPQWPNRKGLGLDTMVDIQCSQDRRHPDLAGEHAPGDRVDVVNPKATNGAPKPS
jgi:hypothetical protein